MYLDYIEVEDLKGMTFVKIENNDNELIFTNDKDETFKMFHMQDCCESVHLEDITGDLEDLLNSPILIAEERDNSDIKLDKYDESFTWTFYEFATIKGNVTLRWYGTSNGYYSESVDIVKL